MMLSDYASTIHSPVTSPECVRETFRSSFSNTLFKTLTDLQMHAAIVAVVTMRMDVSTRLYIY